MSSLPRLDMVSLKAQYLLSEVMAKTVRLKRQGNEYISCCPFHDEKWPSFFVNDAKGFYHCFGCAAHGDIVDWIMWTKGVGFRDAGNILGANVWEPHPPAKIAKIAKAAKVGLDRVQYAQRVWRSGRPIEGTQASAYLAWRGLRSDQPAALRFVMLPYPGVPGTFPVLLAAVQAIGGEVSAVQRIYLAPDGRGKAAVPSPKLTLGTVSGSAIRLGTAGSEVIIAGSLEDGMTVAQAIPHVPVWASPGESMMAAILLPQNVRSVVVAADNDVAGVAFAARAAAAHSSRGLSVRIMRPDPAFKDFNAELMGVRL